MRLGAYWWKRLGEKKFGDRTVRCSAVSGSIFIGIATAAWVGLVGTGYYWPPEVRIICSILIYAAWLSGTMILACAGFVLVRTLIATLRFRAIFGFSPSVTTEGYRALEAVIEGMLTLRAVALEREYKREEKALEYIRSERMVVDHSDGEKLLQDIGGSIAGHEFDLSGLEPAKKKARRSFYRARNAARSPYLPLPFKVKESYKNYLPQEGRCAA